MSIATRIESIEEHIEQAYDELQGLGADLTNVDKNIENISMVLDDIYDDLPKVTGSGTSITLDDTRKGRVDMEFSGNTSQYTTTGKNLFNIDGKYETGTGITYTKNDDGSYTLNGTANGNNFLRGLCYLNEQHTISYTSNVSNSNVIIRTRTGTPSAQTGIQDQLVVSSTSGNLTSSKQFDFVEISIVSGTTLNNFKIYIQLEKGSSATSFEPYTNGASPNPDYPQEVHIVRGDNKINVTGRNLLEGVEYGEINSNSGVESSSTTVIRGTNYIPYDTSSTYYVSVNSSLATQGINLRFYNASKEYLGWSTLTGSGQNLYVNIGTQVTATDLTPKYFKFRQTLSAGPITSLSDNVMITTVNDMNYEPFGNTYNIDLPVENLFDKNGNLSLNYRLTTSGENYMETGSYISEYIPIKSNTTYTKNSSIADAYHRVCFYSNNDTTSFISKSEDNTFTTPSNAKYLRFCGLQTELDTTQLEKGSKQNTFTPYGTTPIELCKIGNYQDYFYKDSDRWYLHKEIGKVVLNGSESGWHTSSLAVTGYKSYYIDSSVRINQDTPGSKCNYFEYKTYNEWQSLLQATFIENTYQAIGIRVVETLAPTLEDFKNWLSTHNTIAYFVLATPTNTEVEYQPLIDQLNELEKAQSKENQTNISQVNNDLPFIISASALKEWSV